MDANGKKYLSHIADYEYDPWGRVLSVKDSSGRDISNEPNNSAAINPFRYRGYYYDTESGFYYLQSRYYDPVIKRFINADSFASTGTGFLGYNMYAYCNNNPVNYADPSGRSFLSFIEDIFDAVGSVAKSILNADWNLIVACGRLAGFDLTADLLEKAANGNEKNKSYFAYCGSYASDLCKNNSIITSKVEESWFWALFRV